MTKQQEFLFMVRFKKYILLGLLLGLANASLKAQEPLKGLDYFIAEALKRSPLLKDLDGQQRAVRIDSMQVKAGYLPQVTATSSGMYAPVVHGYGYDAVITNGQALDALLNVNYNLFGAKSKSNQLQAIALQADSIRLASRLGVLDIRRTMGEQYINAFSSQQQAQFNKDVYQLLDREEKLLKKLTQANVYKLVDYLTFLVTFKQQHLQWKQAEFQFKSDYSMLNYLAGIVDTATHILDDPDFQPPNIRVDKNIFFRKLDLDSGRISNRKAAIAFQYKPKIGLYGNSGFNSSLLFQPYKNWGASVGFTLSIPIYDGHQKQMLYNRIAIEQQTAIANKSFFKDQYTQQLNLLKQQIQDQGTLYQKIKEQIKFSKSLIDVNHKLLQTGDIRIADFVIAINNYLSAQNLLRQTNINRLKLINQLNYWNR